MTFYIWAGIIIGGARHAGACLGAAGIAAVFEFTRFVRDFGFTAFSDTQLASLRWIAIGVILIVMMRLRPEGLLPLRSSRHLKAGPRDEPDAAAEKPAAPALKEASTSDA